MSHKKKKKRTTNKRWKDVKYVCKKGDVEFVVALKNHFSTFC